MNYVDPDGTSFFSAAWGVIKRWFTANGDEYVAPVPIQLAPSPIETQGNTSSRFIRVANPSKTGAQENRIRMVLDWINGNIDSDCSRWLNGVGSAITALEGDSTNLDTVAIGHGTFDTRKISAFTGNNPKQTDLPPGFAITVNDAGAFFVGSYTEGGQTYTLSSNGYAGGTSQAQVSILLHELAHFLGANGFQPDFGNTRAGNQNEQLIRDNCKKTLNAAKNIP